MGNMENRGGLPRRRVRRQEGSVVEPTKRTDLLRLIKERMAQEDGWKLIEDVEPLLDRFQGSIETIGFLQAGEKFIEYKELLDRAKQLGAHYGRHDAQYVYDHQEELLAGIPKTVRYLFFPGTCLMHENGAPIIPYMFRTGKVDKEGREWDVYIFWGEFGFPGDVAQLIRPKNKLQSK